MEEYIENKSGQIRSTKKQKQKPKNPNDKTIVKKSRIIL